MSDKDTVYRQAVIDEIVAWTVEDRPDIEMPTDLVGRINALPSVERKKGHWIEKSDGLYEFYECDKCGKQVNDISNFCPNCGADLRGEQDG